jgi:hypothetical protein
MGVMRWSAAAFSVVVAFLNLTDLLDIYLTAPGSPVFLVHEIVAAQHIADGIFGVLNMPKSQGWAYLGSHLDF